MPCLDPGDHAEDHVENKTQKAFGEAALCAILTVIESDGTLGTLLTNIDYVEAGITRGQLQAWWLRHQADDILRREAETQKAADHIKARQRGQR